MNLPIGRRAQTGGHLDRSEVWKPADVRFGTIVTFRDLASAIAGDKPDSVPTSDQA